jgi:hypothetical protein
MRSTPQKHGEKEARKSYTIKEQQFNRGFSGK